MKSAFLMLASLSVLLSACSNPKFPEKQADSMRLTLYEDERGYYRKTPVLVDVTDPDRIGEIVSVLKEGTRNPDHKCGDAGHITLTYMDGTEVQATILPGHDREYYEFRQMGSNYRVPRDAFLTALKNAGIDIAIIPQGRSE